MLVVKVNIKDILELHHTAIEDDREINNQSILVRISPFIVFIVVITVETRILHNQIISINHELISH